MMQNDFPARLQREYEEYNQKNPRPNILIMGGTGVGKSSLVNACFGAKLAHVSTGQPVTQEISRYEHPDTPVALYDTKGYEIGNGKEEEFIDGMVGFIGKSRQSDQPIHLAWYCIQASGHRVTDFDLKAISKIREQGIPLAVVLTKAELISEEDAGKIRQAVMTGRSMPFFETSAKDKTQPWQLAQLCEWSIGQLPTSLKIAFIAAQKHDLQAKREECKKIIAQHVTGAAITGFSPIPVSDAPILLANQVGMVGRIIYVYGLQSLLKAPGTQFAATLIGPVIMRSGIMAAGSLAKWVPGIGTAIGGMINATVASSITLSIGWAFVNLCEQMLKSEMEGGEMALQKVLDSAADIFRENFAMEMKKER